MIRLPPADPAAIDGAEEALGGALHPEHRRWLLDGDGLLTSPDGLLMIGVGPLPSDLLHPSERDAWAGCALVELTEEVRDWILEGAERRWVRRFGRYAPGFPRRHACIAVHLVNHRTYWMALGSPDPTVFAVQSPRFSLEEDLLYGLRKHRVPFGTFASEVEAGRIPFDGPAIEGLGRRPPRG